MKVMILADYFKEEAAKLIPELTRWLSERNVLVTVLRQGEEIESSQKFDFAVVLGGDGFITKKSLVLARLNLPFLGINFGTKGFLAVAERDNWQDVLKKVIDGKYTVDRRVVLSATHFGKRKVKKHFEAAGNVYIRHRAYLILFSVSIDGKVVFKELDGDGVIVANATGATAYNLAAKGSIISSGLVVTPICPHRLDVVSLPVPESAKKIEIVYHGRKGVQRDDEGCLLFSDSEKCPILPGERLEIQKSDKEVALIIPDGFSFFEALQGKLGLSR